MIFTAISDRILIIQDPELPFQNKAPQTGVIYSTKTDLVKEGDHVVFAKGNHPVQREFLILRAEQIYAKIAANPST